MPTVLIADDEKNIRSTLARSFRLDGWTTLEAADGEAALGQLEGGEIDLVILDLQMPVLDGIGLLERMAERGIRVPALVLTAHGTIEKAVRAVRLGAHDFIEKPPSLERIRLAAENALRLRGLEEENRRLAEEAGLGAEMLGESEAMKALGATIRRVAPTDAGVLLLGENGTGKELVARALHAASPRAARPMVTVNCAAIPDALFESELFGHARGAFTGAGESRRGRFQRSDGGTLFLDEIGELPLALQPKLLRALETGEVERVGGQGVERVNVRVIAATNRDLETEIRAGRFREDLYYRLLVVPIRVPALRERRDDIPLLARSFLESACRRNRIRAKRIDEAAIALLRGLDWPGNVRELRNTIERLAILVPDELIRVDHIAGIGGVSPPSGARGRGPGSALEEGSPPVTAGSDASEDLAAKVARFERSLVLAVLERHRWKMSKAAHELGLERSHLYKKLKALGIDRPDED